MSIDATKKITDIFKKPLEGTVFIYLGRNQMDGERYKQSDQHKEVI